MAMQCPSCGGELLELDRSGVRIDACRNCRGVWLDRGELDHILERERQVVGAADDEDFIREMTGSGKQAKHGYGFDSRTAERIYHDYRSHKKHKKRKSFLDELFD
jgi:Zn-finger nucleic acid-binding protein